MFRFFLGGGDIYSCIYIYYLHFVSLLPHHLSLFVPSDRSVYVGLEVGEDVPSRSRRSMKPKLRRSSSSFVQAGAVADGI